MQYVLDGNVKTVSRPTSHKIDCTKSS